MLPYTSHFYENVNMWQKWVLFMVLRVKEPNSPPHLNFFLLASFVTPLNTYKYELFSNNKYSRAKSFKLQKDSFISSYHGRYYYRSKEVGVGSWRWMRLSSFSNGSKWFTMIQNGAKWLKMVKKGAKWFRKVQNGS